MHFAFCILRTTYVKGDHRKKSFFGHIASYSYWNSKNICLLSIFFLVIFYDFLHVRVLIKFQEMSRNFFF